MVLASKPGAKHVVSTLLGISLLSTIVGVIFIIKTQKRKRWPRNVTGSYDKLLSSGLSPNTSPFLQYPRLSPIEFTLSDKRALDDKYRKMPEVTVPTIFLAIASYRDPELCITLLDAYDKAYCPLRVYAGVIQQNDESDSPTCHAENVQQYIPEGRLTVCSMPYRNAKGPTYARSICESMYSGEKYFMMVDSHMRFEPGWDAELIEMMLKSPRPAKTIITQYPEGYIREEDKGLKTISYKIHQRKGWRYQASKGFNEQGIPEFESFSTNDPIPYCPQLVPFWGACLHFSEASVLTEVPFAPFTENLFFGEEILFGARAFTNGYDLRSPTHSVVYHLWDREHRKTFWEIDVLKRRDRSIQYVKRVLRGEAVGTFALGTQRTIEDYEQYTGLDFKNEEETRPRKNWTAPAKYL